MTGTDHTRKIFASLSSVLPHCHTSSRQMFSAGASLSAMSAGSIIYCLFAGVAAGHTEMDTSFTTDFIPSPPCRQSLLPPN